MRERDYDDVLVGITVLRWDVKCWVIHYDCLREDVGSLLE